MERCPVCQAPARAGARFCTICGYRLPDDLTQDAAPTPAATERPVVAGWPTAAAADGEDRPTDPYGGGQGPGSAVAGDAVEAGQGPGQAGSAAEDAVGHPSSAAVVAVPDDAAPDDDGAGSNDSPTWPHDDERGAPAAPIWRSAGEDAAEDSVIAWGAPAPARETEAAEGAGDEQGSAAGAGDDAIVVSDAGGEDGSQAADAAEPSISMLPPAPAPPWGFATDADQDPPPAASRAAPAAEARERVMALLEEARALLPLVGGPAFDARGIAAELEAAADVGPDLADLRTAIDRARATPSDVGVVLALSGRVDDVIALADARDRLAEAARRAAAALRGTTGSADGD